MECMRLSLRKGAQVALSRAAWQEIRVRSGPNEQNRWVPHISPSVGEMWEFTDLTLEVFRHNLHRPASIRSFPHLAKPGQIWGTLVRGREKSFISPLTCRKQVICSG
jgi:hypothetical protein